MRKEACNRVSLSSLISQRWKKSNIIFYLFRRHKNKYCIIGKQTKKKLDLSSRWKNVKNKKKRRERRIIGMQFSKKNKKYFDFFSFQSRPDFGRPAGSKQINVVIVFHYIVGYTLCNERKGKGKYTRMNRTVMVIWSRRDHGRRYINRATNGRHAAAEGSRAEKKKKSGSPQKSPTA